MFGGLSLSPAAPSCPPRSPTSAATRSIRSSTWPTPSPGCDAKRTGIKRALLDQQLVSGIGNIYADEALWAARMHYARPTQAMSRARAAEVVIAAAAVMRGALGQGGTSFDALYVNVNGSSGYFDRSLAAYGREGEPCPRCGTPIRREPFMNRSSYRCPRCQRQRRARLG